MSIRILTGDCRQVLATLPAESVHCCVCSPPYFNLRDYQVAGQIGLERTAEEYIAELVSVFREVRKVLRRDGTAWIVLGDSFANKQLLMIPARVALALQADGWYLRSDIIWSKSNPMPEPTKDRPTSAHEHVFMLAKSQTYYFDMEAVKEPASTFNRQGSNRVQSAKNLDGVNAGVRNGVPRDTYDVSARNIRNVWTVATQPSPLTHFAQFPPALIEPCIKAGTSERGCCPHCGAGWVRQMEETGRKVCSPDLYGRPRVIELSGNGESSQQQGGAPAGLFTKEKRHTGWSPSCACPAHDPVPATVLDPFGGAGTTGLVSDRLGRNAILIELSPAYAAMAERRLQDDGGMFTSVQLEAAE